MNCPWKDDTELSQKQALFPPNIYLALKQTVHKILIWLFIWDFIHFRVIYYLLCTNLFSLYCWQELLDKGCVVSLWNWSIICTHS